MCVLVKMGEMAGKGKYMIDDDYQYHIRLLWLKQNVIFFSWKETYPFARQSEISIATSSEVLLIQLSALPMCMVIIFISRNLIPLLLSTFVSFLAL